MYPKDILTANAGNMSNKGIELSLNATVVKNRSFSWTTSVNLAHNVNKILSISSAVLKAQQFYTANNLVARSQSGVSGYQIIKEGYALGSFYTLRYAGKNSAGLSQFYGKDGSVATTNSNFSSFDFTGSAQPKLLYGWSNNFRYKQFDLNFFLRGVTGNKILNATRAYISDPAQAGATNIPVASLSESAADKQNQFLSDRYIESGSYLRLDNATIGYTLKTKASYSFRFYVSGNNLFIITDYKGMDPEVNMGGQTPGIDNSNFYPKTRSLLMGVNLVF
jgi:iron complex outermembrane receptor protein